jgi:hypothetical protein
MRSSHLICHSKFLSSVTSLVSDMRSSYMIFHTQLQHQVTSMVSDLRSSHMISINNFNLQWPQWWVIWGHPSWCIIHNIVLQWPRWWGTWGHPTSCFIQYFDLQWPHWWVTWGHPDWCVIQKCALVISIRASRQLQLSSPEVEFQSDLTWNRLFGPSSEVTREISSILHNTLVSFVHLVSLLLTWVKTKKFSSYNEFTGGGDFSPQVLRRSSLLTEGMRLVNFSDGITQFISF